MLLNAFDARKQRLFNSDKWYLLSAFLSNSFFFECFCSNDVNWVAFEDRRVILFLYYECTRMYVCTHLHTHIWTLYIAELALISREKERQLFQSHSWRSLWVFAMRAESEYRSVVYWPLRSRHTWFLFGLACEFYFYKASKNK